MFTAFGILSILAGIFVFFQGSMLSALSNLADSSSRSPVAGSFMVVAILLIIAGAFSIGSSGGAKKGSVKTAAVMYLIAFLVAFNNRASAGDMMVWTFICAMMTFVYVLWLSIHRQDGNEAMDEPASDKWQVEESGAAPIPESKGNELAADHADAEKTQSKSNVEVLEELGLLHGKGILTDEEYTKKKQEVLGRM